MERIIFIIARMFFRVIYYWIGFNKLAKNKDYVKAHEFIGKGASEAIKKGRVSVEVEGLKNIPKEDGFVFFPNHQGLFDGLMFFAYSPRPFAVVLKKEAAKLPLVKSIVGATDSIAMNREDIRQSIQVISEMSKRVKEGRNFIIFPEGTRSRAGNKLLDFKGGSFKAATMAKAPIVPCALINSFKVFDGKGIKPLKVKLIFLQPIYYEEYKDMKCADIAVMVKNRIEETIANDPMARAELINAK